MNKSTFVKLLSVYLAILFVVLFGGLVMSMVTRGDFPAFLPFPITALVGLVLLGIFIAIGIGIAVYRDAEQRGMEPLLWALVAALVPYFLGLIAYLVVRQPRLAACSSCGAKIKFSDSFCRSCGHRVSQACPGCGHPVNSEARFCPNCGANLEMPHVPTAPDIG